MKSKTSDHQSKYEVQYFYFLYNYAYIQTYNQLYKPLVLLIQIHFGYHFQEQSWLGPCTLSQGIQESKYRIQFRKGKFWRMMARTNQGKVLGIFFLRGFVIVFYLLRFFVLYTNLGRILLDLYTSSLSCS